MRWIDPTDGLGLFDRGDVEVNDDGFVVASNQHAFKAVGVFGSRAPLGITATP
jgi:hypothetical protein